MKHAENKEKTVTSTVTYPILFQVTGNTSSIARERFLVYNINSKKCSYMVESTKIVEITAQQRKFCELLILHDGEWTATECAIEAGYSEKSARQIASQLQNREKYPKVYDYILMLREEQHKKYHVNYNRHMRRLKQLSLSAEEKGNYTAAVSAEISRGKAAGLYVDRKEILTGSIDNMPKQEVERRLEELKKRFPKVVDSVALEVKEKNERKKSKPKNSKKQ